MTLLDRARQTMTTGPDSLPQAPAAALDNGSGTARAKQAPATSRSRQLEVVEAVCALLDVHEGGPLTLGALAAQVRVSPWHLQRLFKRLVGISPRDYAAARREERFRAELRHHGQVAQATYGAGYGSSSRVYEKAARTLGMTPATYAKGGKGARIAYATAPTDLGLLLVATTAKGLCFLALHDLEAILVAELHQEFPAAREILRDDLSIRPALEQVAAYLKGSRPHLDLPLDVQATAFQRRVWNELLAIPYGETASYSEIAERLGIPKGQRAVGRACATNPVSLVIPCHRALRDSGGLGGYRWGLNRKEQLLHLEADHQAT
jgi:AraC family transcriptional regulator of adaptative response/methylated-DNA-[protein]-cysteine methyltransferase|tara:strand:- start:2490 stop:3452 length:963 start_codon:yes stop_codon:yes gene_type:complete